MSHSGRACDWRGRGRPPGTERSASISIWNPEDAPTYVSRRDDTIFRWTTEDPYLTANVAEAAIRHYIAEPDVLPFAIVDAAHRPA